MTTLWSRDREIQEIARKVPDPLSMKAGSGNETNTSCGISTGPASMAYSGTSPNGHSL